MEVKRMGIDAISGGYSAGMSQGEYETYKAKQPTNSGVSTNKEVNETKEEAVVTMANGEKMAAGELRIQDVAPEKIKSAIAEVNQKIKPTRTQCQFSYHEDSKRISIKVIDESTKEVIREIPPEKTLDMIAKVMDLAGILVDEKR